MLFPALQFSADPQTSCGQGSRKMDQLYSPRSQPFERDPRSGLVVWYERQGEAPMLLNTLLVICMLAWTIVIGWAVYCGMDVNMLLALSLIYGGVYFGARQVFFP